jgi:hypothetical protein
MTRWILHVFPVLFVPLGAAASDVTLEYWKGNEARPVAASASAATAASMPASTRPAIVDSSELPHGHHAIDLSENAGRRVRPGS